MPIDRGLENPAGGVFKSYGTRAWMAVEATDALQQKISGGEVGDKEIGIDVHGLLDDLGGDEHAASGAACGFHAELLHPLAFVLLALKMRETAEEQADWDGV